METYDFFYFCLVCGKKIEVKGSIVKDKRCDDCGGPMEHHKLVIKRREEERIVLRPSTIKVDRKIMEGVKHGNGEEATENSGEEVGVKLQGKVSKDSQ